MRVSPRLMPSAKIAVRRAIFGRRLGLFSRQGRGDE
jgi:hypothetical protein